MGRMGEAGWGGGGVGWGQALRGALRGHGWGGAVDGDEEEGAPG